MWPCTWNVSLNASPVPVLYKPPATRWYRLLVAKGIIEGVIQDKRFSIWIDRSISPCLKEGLCVIPCNYRLCEAQTLKHFRKSLIRDSNQASGSKGLWINCFPVECKGPEIWVNSMDWGHADYMEWVVIVFKFITKNNLEKGVSGIKKKLLNRTNVNIVGYSACPLISFKVLITYLELNWNVQVMFSLV